MGLTFVDSLSLRCETNKLLQVCRGCCCVPGRQRVATPGPATPDWMGFLLLGFGSVWWKFQFSVVVVVSLSVCGDGARPLLDRARREKEGFNNGNIDFVYPRVCSTYGSHHERMVQVL